MLSYDTIQSCSHLSVITSTLGAPDCRKSTNSLQLAIFVIFDAIQFVTFLSKF